MAPTTRDLAQLHQPFQAPKISIHNKQSSEFIRGPNVKVKHVEPEFNRSVLRAWNKHVG